MEPFILFEEIKNTIYKKSGDDVDWAVRIFKDEKVVRLFFEASTTKRDWINNFNFPIKIYKKQESCLKVARGWGNAYKSCNDEIMNLLIAVSDDYADYEVQIAGWSYGGAMAVLAAEDFYYRTGKQASVYTFGAPKPIWGRKCHKYVSSCVKEAKQYAHVNDCVPLCPPLPGYKMIKKVKIGKGFNIFKLFKPDIYHLIYGNSELYK